MKRIAEPVCGLVRNDGHCEPVNTTAWEAGPRAHTVRPYITAICISYPVICGNSRNGEIFLALWEIWRYNSLNKSADL